MSTEENTQSSQNTQNVLSPTDEEKNLAIILDIASIFVLIIPALIVYLIAGDKPFLKEQAKYILNGTIFYAIAFLISFILNATVVLAIIGIPLGVIALIGLAVELIMGAVSNSKGELFKFHFMPQLIK